MGSKQRRNTNQIKFDWFQLDDNIYENLHHSFGFQSQDINKNKSTLIDGQALIPDFVGFLAELVGGARTAKNPKGYVIGTIKRKIEEINET